MKILELRSENFKRLKAVSIKPDGSIVTIAGRNGAGKTSILDSIHVALAGKAVAPAVPIRQGAEQARIRLDLGELIVTRTFTRKGDDEYTTSLTVESPDGARFSSPQKMLDDLLGELSFDPLAFTRMQPKDQLVALRRFVPDVDFTTIEIANKTDYDKRRDLNREAKALRARAAGIEVLEGASEPIDEAGLVAKLEEAGEHNAEIERRRARREKVADEARQLSDAASRDRAQAEDLRRQAQELIERANIAEQQAKEREAEAETLKQKLADAEALPEPIDTAEIREAIARARDHNAAAERAKQRQALEQQAAKIERSANELTEQMARRAQMVADAIAAAKLPVEGISFADDHVTYNGLPLDQASDAEQLRVSVAIAAAMNPRLKVIRVRDGSLLDDDGLKLLAELAEQHGAQVWLEKVDSTGKVGFVIEDGEVVAARDEEDAA